MIEPLIIRIDKGNVYWYDIELKKRKYGFFFSFFFLETQYALMRINRRRIGNEPTLTGNPPFSLRSTLFQRN